MPLHTNWCPLSFTRAKKRSMSEKNLTSLISGKNPYFYAKGFALDMLRNFPATTILNNSNKQKTDVLGWNIDSLYRFSTRYRFEKTFLFVPKNRFFAQSISDWHLYLVCCHVLSDCCFANFKMFNYEVHVPTHTMQINNNYCFRFQRRFGLPGVIGCIDCTHVALVKPNDEEHLFL